MMVHSTMIKLDDAQRERIKAIEAARAKEAHLHCVPIPLSRGSGARFSIWLGKDGSPDAISGASLEEVIAAQENEIG